MIRINQIKVPFNADEKEIHTKISRLIGTSSFEIKRIVKKSLDARKKDDICYIYSFDIKSDQENKILSKHKNNNNIMLTSDKKYIFPYKNSHANEFKPLIVGAGPAGYFCGLKLAQAGYNPIIIERGKTVEERYEDVTSFWDTGKLNANSNVSFGEGGAGTFSDGKLNTGIKDKEGRIKSIIEDFVSFGAPYDILYNSKPHIGTDYLMTVMHNMRDEIIKLGGEIYFNTCFTDFSKNDTYFSVNATSSDSEALAKYGSSNATITLNCSSIVFAIGHSARDTFFKLYENKLPMEAKAFAIGVRVEHPTKVINEAQYGTGKNKELLPAADYKMTYRASNERGVYSFCMCPGGFVVNASTDENQSVVNGMSNHQRNEANSNSAIVVNVTPEDFKSEKYEDVTNVPEELLGVLYQKKYEALAYKEGNGYIPVQIFEDFKANKKTEKIGHITPNIKGKYTLANLNNCLPQYVINAIIEGINYYGKSLKGFDDNDTVLAGIETRTSSPVRIVRDDSFMSINYPGIFPCGEGCGYAGGITSAAVDGIKVAEAVAKYINSTNEV